MTSRSKKNKVGRSVSNGKTVRRKSSSNKNTTQGNDSLKEMNNRSETNNLELSIAPQGKDTQIHVTPDEKADTRYGNDRWLIFNSRIPGIITVVTAILAVASFLSNVFHSTNCSNFYGIPRQYFQIDSSFGIRMTLLLISIIVIYMPFAYAIYYRKKKNTPNKFLLIVIGFSYTSLCMVFADILAKDVMHIKNVVFYLSVLALSVIASIVLSILLPYQISRSKKQLKTSKTGTTIIGITWLFNAGIILAISFSIFNNNAEFIRSYEILNDESQVSRVVVAHYYDNFVTLECDIEGSTLTIIKNGSYKIEQMDGTRVENVTFGSVICE